MAPRLLQLDDLRCTTDQHQVAGLFRKLGYDAQANPLEISHLDLPSRSAESIKESYLIADVNGGAKNLQVILFQLHKEAFSSPYVASYRFKAIASDLLDHRPSNFLLLGTKDYNQLLLINPRRSFDEKHNLTVNIRKLLIDRLNPTNYDRDRLEAIAVENRDSDKLYQAHCEAFNVEKLTKHFYLGYKTIFEKVQSTVKEYNPHPYFADSSRLQQFSQRLLGRIMFLYFLQKKEFLGGNPNFFTANYPKQSDLEDTDYYSNFLEPLFFETLNRKRLGMESPWGKIPYLNGGLFDRDYGEGIIDALGLETPPQITLPNSLFAPLAGSDQSILDFFNMYNFTISENITGEEDIAIDPEMLGKVFENTLAPPERGKTGTFYTPRKIVEFMCTEALSRYLSDETRMDVDKIKEIIDKDLDDNDYISLMTTEEVKKLKVALDNLKALDPAVGSGAFPLGLMQIILKVKQVIARREGMTIERGSLVISQWKREIISHNLYGVDIKPEAIEIAKLRMWLSLVVDIPNLENVEPLPNLDYKLMCGDSLISTVNGENLIPVPQQQQQLLLDVTPIQGAIQPLLELQELYFNADAQSRSNLRQEILAAERNIFQVAIGDRIGYLENKLKELTLKLNQMKGKSAKKWEQDKTEIENKITQLKALANSVAKGEKALNFFQYYLHFRDVFDSKGGFDLVIGNPPYVRQEEIKELKPALQQEYECYTGVADLYVYFYEKGFNLLKSGGYLTYISSNKWFRSNYGEKLRKFLGENGRIEYLIDFGDASVFEAIAYPSIILVSKNQTVNHKAYVLNWDSEAALNEFTSVFKQKSFYIEQKCLNPDGWRLESPTVLALLDKLKAAGTPLGEYVEGKIYYGIKTGFNEAFIVDQETRDRLISEHPSSAEVLKPLIRGRDVKRWCVNFQEQYLIKIESSENKQHPWSNLSGKEAEKIFAKTYPAIYNWFNLYRDKLINRCDQGNFFWELRSCAYWQEFETSKIVYPNICKQPEFYLDKERFFTNQKAFIIPSSSLTLLGILNSSIMMWLFSQTLAKLQNNYYEPSKVFMEQIPIPPVHEIDRQIIENLVQKCLDAKGKGVEKYEQEIDDRIAHLYGLTSEEIKIIRGETP